MKAYADSSFIVALYLPQQTSVVAGAFVERYDTALPFTPWHRLEVRNAIRLAVYQRLIDSRQGKIQLRQLEIDLREQSLIVHTGIDWTTVLRLAEKLGATHNESVGCRSADLFHVAAALHWGADYFETFDERQKKLAKAAGLNVRN